MPPVTTLDITKQLPGYALSDIIYQGGRTLVFRGIKLKTQQAVIVKVLATEYPRLADLVQFRNQYTLTKQLAIAGIVKPLELVSYGKGYALVMPDEGLVSLRQYLQHTTPTIEEILQIVVQVAAILAELHQRHIVHKDIKPDNLLIHPVSQEITLTDFSIASCLPKETQAIQHPKYLEGTLAYLAPEQTGRMNRGIDYRTDFYGLGVTLYELLTGQLPFTTREPMVLIHCHMTQCPPAAHEVNGLVPPMVSAIATKLMAKNAEDRYRSAAGLQHDLEYCLKQWQTLGEIPAFTLGQRDRGDRFVIPEKLYGRDIEIQMLLNAFERVTHGGTELMMVAGFSGIGKTAVINEIHKPITEQQGYFIQGKFDQFNHHSPLSGFMQALRDLVRQLLSESDRHLAQWKTDILAAVGENGQLLIDVIPELGKVIGAQPTPPALAGAAARNRFNLTFQKFIEVFTTSAYPLVIFLDDLQWADGASLQLIKLLAKGEGRLLLLGAYRDNEVTKEHILTLALEVIATETSIQTLTIVPLNKDDIAQWVAEALHCPQVEALPLTEFLYRQAAGNPFFTVQLLTALHQDGQIQFQPELGHWCYSLEQLSPGAIAADVVDFMVVRLQRLAAETQAILRVAACIGNSFSVGSLSQVMSLSIPELATGIWPALQQGLLLPEGTNYRLFQSDDPETAALESVAVHYRFVHDRVQQAAYQLIPSAERSALHWQIGQQLYHGGIDSEQRDDLFDLVNHLNRGCPVTLTLEERQLLVNLNLTAAHQAKQSTAYDLAIAYGSRSLELLGDIAWTDHYPQTLETANLIGDAAYLAGDFEQVATLTAIILANTKGQLLDQITAYNIQILTAIANGNVRKAVDIGLAVLNQLGLSFPEAATPADFMAAIQAVRTKIGDQAIATLAERPTMTDPVMLAAMEMIRAIAPATYVVDPNLYPLLVCKQVLLSLQWGNNPYSGGAYGAYGLLLCAALGEMATAAEFGQLATQVVEKFDDQFNASFVCLMNYGYIFPWQMPLRQTVQPLLDGYHQGLEVGNLEAAGYCLFVHGFHEFLSGGELQTLSQNLALYSQAAANLNQTPTFYKINISWQLVNNLRDNPLHPTELRGTAFNEEESEAWCEAAQDTSIFAYIALGRMMLAYLFGETAVAQEQRRKYMQVMDAVRGLQLIPAFYFYDSLCQFADMMPLSAEEEEARLAIVVDNQQQLRTWAIAAPENMQHKYDLVEAEKCRQQGDKARAIDLYDQAIAGAQSHGYVQEEALANELAAKFYLAWGKDKVAAAYMQEAYYAYGRWGATTKIKNLEIRYPTLLAPILEAQETSDNLLKTLTTLVPTKVSSQSSVTETEHDRLNEALDFASVLQASQLLSSTIQLDDLLRQFTQIILQNSGSLFCALFLPDTDQELQLRAIATDAGAELKNQPLVEANNVPIKLIQYVKNTQEVFMADACRPHGIIIDDYLQSRKPKSLLCLPLLNQGNLIGIAYLENAVATGVYTQERILILNFLCTQAAIFIQNSLLYTELEASLQAARKTSDALTESIALSAGQQRILASIAQGLSLTEILTETALYIESQSHHEAYCSFLFIKDDKLCDGVAPSLPQAYNELIDGLPIGPAVGSCGTAAFLKASVTVNDIMTDPLWANFVAVAEQYGLGACASTPIMGSNGQVLATLAMYQPCAAEYTQHDRQLMVVATDLARIAIERHQADIELQQLNLKMIQGEKMATLGNLVAGVAHEVNNPVGFLKGSVAHAKGYLEDLLEYIETYQTEQPPNEVMQSVAEDLDLEFVQGDFPQLLASMKSATERIAGISTSLRTFSRADKVHKVQVNLHEGLDSTLMILKYRLKANEARPAIAIEREYGELPSVPCFPSQLNQVFMNILANAIDMFDEMAGQTTYKALETTPQVLTVRTKYLKAEKSVELRIIDNGKGMPKEVQAKVFENLFTTKEIGKGTGLGLAIAQQIVRDIHGGNITVQSEVGQGSEFCLRLPL